jgi:hypothetical protein
MKDPVWTVSQVLNNHGDKLAAILLELYNQIGLGPDSVEYADSHGKLVEFDMSALTPGTYIRIFWTPQSIVPEWAPPEEEPDDLTALTYDDGYVMTLPNMEGNDVAMAGLVHIPYPISGDGETELPPFWITLNSLLGHPGLDHIELLSGVSGE